MDKVKRVNKHREEVGGSGYPGREVSITMIFVVAGILWTLLADFLLDVLGEKLSIPIPDLHILTGLLFVGASGAVIFVMMHKSSAKVASAKDGIESVFNTSPVPMAVISKDSFRVIKMNGAALQLFGPPGSETGSRFLRHLVVSENDTSLQQLQLFMTTGMEQPGVWQFRHSSGKVFPAEVMISRQAYQGALVVTFLDVSEKTLLQQQVSEMNRKLLHQVNLRTTYLERENEELAYRASQTEHVNNELIAVNEQLQSVNRKVAAANERLQDSYASLQSILSVFRELVCTYAITPAGVSFDIEGKREVFGTDDNVLSKPWFWLDMVECGNPEQKDAFERTVLERGEAIRLFNIMTKNNGTRRILVQVRMERRDEQTTVLTAAFCDVTRFIEADENSLFQVKTA